ncbi:MAG: S8 family serine peptidase [Scytonema sp. RU_4_4]|nr:S8 family serine peptidase [Scytonema sp. RU_4_4]NJR72776.1 S8 family serine peptidase [Scytonema sp. CRU_2_7]
MLSPLKSNSSLFHQGLNVTSISSVDSFYSNNDYSVNLKGHSSFNTAINNRKENAREQLFNDNGYNFTSGYGLIDAAAAVGKAAGQDTFTDVPDLGSNNWGADLVKAPEVWAKGYTGQGVVVAVVDTGVDYNHDDLKDNIWTNSKEIADNGIDDNGDGYIDDVYGWNFADNNNNTLDNSDSGHGTHVAGTIAGVKNDFGVTGIAYDAKIMPVKVLDESGSGSYNSIVNGIYYAVDHGANVINLSLGGDSPDSTLEKAIEYASSKGVVVVMASGNDGGFQPGYPAGYADKWGIAVGAIDANNNMADFSNKAGINSLTYVTAPGVDVYSTVPDNKYTSYNGTSMAAPHVAGVVALMLSANDSLTDAQVRQIVAETAVHSTQVPSFGLNDFITNSRTTTSNFSVTEYQDSSSCRSMLESLSSGKISTSQDQLDNVNSMLLSSLSVSSTLGSQFLGYQTVLDNNVSYSISDYDGTTDFEDILKKRKDMLEE